jgi:hypothetical protein
VLRDRVISRRRNLKGTNHVIVEDLTSLNIDTINRLCKNDSVRQMWSWNGRIYDILNDGNKVLIQPLQTLSVSNCEKCGAS